MLSDINFDGHGILKIGHCNVNCKNDTIKKK